MREIKFRVWDAENGKMLEYQSHMSMYPFHMTPHGKVYKDGRLMPYELMQFTGLHDKNGKEIYEGDIVEFRSEENIFISIDDKNAPEIMRSPVVFEQGCFLFRGQYGYEGLEISFDEVKVVGNIYENSDLLT